jgi:hypothetical protein
MNRITTSMTILVASLGIAACTSEGPDDTNTLPPGSTTGGEDTTFDHMNDGISPWDLVDRLAKEGPPKFTSHVHSCPKVRFKTLGAILTSVGVNVNAAGALTAGGLYRSGGNAMGAPNYANRIRENIGISTSGASREFDIFAAAADEIIAAVPTLARCQTAGTPAVLFNSSDQCDPSGISCIIGVPADLAHVELCNLTVSHASDIPTGKRLAVATMMAAAYTCE